MIDKVGFYNFRKFKSLPPISLGGVNILVGENNSGKSTFTKGVLLMSNFLSEYPFDDMKGEDPYPHKQFHFTKDKRLYIDNFYQALSLCETDGIIGLNCSIDDFDFSLYLWTPWVFEDTEEWKKEEILIVNKEMPLQANMKAVYPELLEKKPELYKKSLSVDEASVLEAEFTDRKRGLIFGYDYYAKYSYVNFPGVSILKRMYEVLDSLYYSDCSQEERLALLAEKDRLDNELECHKDRGDRNTSTIWIDPHTASHDRIVNIINSMRLPSEKNKTVIDSYRELCSLHRAINIEYIYAHSVHQMSSYSRGEGSGYVDETVSQYYEHRNNDSDSFVRSWMSYFDIGEDFKIAEIDGKKLSVEISDGNIWLDLSSKGIGAIQLFIFLLRMAVIVVSDKVDRTTVIIEEPEQNLHPKLQSLLADFFWEVNGKYGCQFIVETHSEYLVRKSQVIVAKQHYSEENISENPFRVFYFRKEGLPYRMNYRPDGKFSNEFGPGFFDEASNLAFELF